MIARALTAGLDGIEARQVDVEVDIGGGLPSFTIVGMTDKAVQEARERVKPALRNSGFGFPVHRLTVNLAPAELRKEGSAFDLAIAAGILGASGVLEGEFADAGIIGELGLDGSVRPVRGVLAMSVRLRAAGASRVFVPAANAGEASLSGLPVHPVPTLLALVSHLRGESLIPAAAPSPEIAPATPWLDLCEIQGQQIGKRALEIAAAGGHHLLLTGPPGAGKSMLGRALVGLLPDLGHTSASEVTTIHSVAGLLGGPGMVERPPLRSPHHSITPAGLLGGGSHFHPGEVTLAHRGVLLLDELPEFRRDCVEALREPLEEGIVRVSRASGTRILPASFCLVASANPCPCGGGESNQCECPPPVLAAYRRRVSGPFRDRLDLSVEVRPIRLDMLAAGAGNEGTLAVRRRVADARERQATRQAGRLNSELSAADLASYCDLEPAAIRLVPTVAESYGLTGRGFHGALRVARTIADLAGSVRVARDHLLEACEYRAA